MDGNRTLSRLTAACHENSGIEFSSDVCADSRNQRVKRHTNLGKSFELVNAAFGKAWGKPPHRRSHTLGYILMKGCFSPANVD